MTQFGLIGFPLSHSFSKAYFTEKFQNLGLSDYQYGLYELPDIAGFPELLKANPNLAGLNVTIPHKESVMPYLDEIDADAQAIGAVNVIRIQGGKTKGYNSDYAGFRNSLLRFLNDSKPSKALILGTGGASKAVCRCLLDLGIEYTFVSRTAAPGQLSYAQLHTQEIVAQTPLIINSTPLGMYPNVDGCPDLPYAQIRSDHFLFDLIYNPRETLFMKKGKERGAQTIDGLEMLIGQAEKAWEIWQQ
jgi:shikimate dehydrogenase